MKNVRVTCTKAIGFMRQWLLLMLLMMMSVGVLSTNAYAMEKMEVSNEEDEVPQALDYKLCLGQKVELPVREGEYISNNEKIILIENGNLIAVGEGVAEVYNVSDEAEYKFCKVTVVKNPKLANIKFKEGDLETFIVGGGTYQINVAAFKGLQCVFTSKTPKLAAVTTDGSVTPVAEGLAIIHVAVKDSYDWVYEYDIPIRIAQPKYSVTKTNLAVGATTTLTVQGTANKQIVAASTNGDVCSIVTVAGNVITIKGRKAGQATIIGTIGTVAFSCVVNVTDPKINGQYGFYVKNKKFKLKLSGTNADSKAVWASGDKTVATVDQKGNVKTKKIGSTMIACTVDGKVIVYYLAVGNKKAVKAMKYGYKQVGKKKYSQARRMSKNYFDCSSFVYRCYKKAGKYLIAKSKWAPVAASIAKYYTQKGKRIKPSGKYYNLNYLQPGDLVCWGGKKAKKNGRYKRIYHIAMYIGNGLTMESSSSFNNVVIRDRGKFPKKEVPVIVRP